MKKKKLKCSKSKMFRKCNLFGFCLCWKLNKWERVLIVIIQVSHSAVIKLHHELRVLRSDHLMPFAIDLFSLSNVFMCVYMDQDSKKKTTTTKKRRKMKDFVSRQHTEDTIRHSFHQILDVYFCCRCCCYKVFKMFVIFVLVFVHKTN